MQGPSVKGHSRIHLAVLESWGPCPRAKSFAYNCTAGFPQGWEMLPDEALGSDRCRTPRIDTSQAAVPGSAKWLCSFAPCIIWRGRECAPSPGATLQSLLSNTLINANWASAEVDRPLLVSRAREEPSTGNNFQCYCPGLPELRALMKHATGVCLGGQVLLKARS